MRTLLLTLAFLLIPVTGTAQPADEGASTFTILHTNDLHGRHAPFEVTSEDATSQTGDPGGRPADTVFRRTGRVGGFGRQATVVDSIRQARGDDNTLLVNGGDTFADDLLGERTGGRAVIELMNALDYDFMALGNHDFDYGVDQTRTLQEVADFPMRGANVLLEGTGEPFGGDPTMLFEKNGLGVGLLAMSYHNTPWTAGAGMIRGLRYVGPVEAAKRHLPDLQDRSDVVVVVSHLGTAADRELAREVDGIDIIVGGHSHNHITAPKKVNGTWILEALSDGGVLGELRVTTNENGDVTDVNQKLHMLWADQVEPDPAVAKMVDSLRAPHEDALEEVLTRVPEPVARDYKSESAFEALTGEIMIEKTGAEVAFQPGIGYGVTIGPGPVTREDLYTLIPHPARLATVELTGAQILSVLEQSAMNLKPADRTRIVGGLVQTAGMSWTVDYTQPMGNRIRDVEVNGEPIEPTRFYDVVTHSGMIQGTHRYEAFSQGRNLQQTNRMLNDLVEDYMREQEQLEMPPLGKIRVIQDE